MTVVYGTDFSERAAGGQRAAAAIASRIGAADLWLVHVLDPALSLFDAGTLDALETAATRRLDEEARALQPHTAARVRPAVSRGYAADETESVAGEVVRFAERQGASLLAVSSRGYARVPLIRIGGTSERIALTASMPVVVVRDPAPFEAWGRGERPLRVLLGVDGTAASQPAVRFVSELRRAGRCDVVVARVYRAEEAVDRYGIPPRVDVQGEVERLVLRDLEAEVGALPGDGSLAFRTRLAAGRTGDHLLEIADAEAAELLVVGTHRRRGLGRLVSVSSIALHFAHASVGCVPAPAVRAPEPRRVPRLRRVLIATDFSEQGNSAVPYGYALLGRGGEVLLVHVVAPGGAAAPSDEHLPLVARARALVPRLAPGQDVVTRIEIVEGKDAARAICETAERSGADAICVASHGRSGLARAALGSIAVGVLRTTRKPVFVVRPPPA